MLRTFTVAHVAVAVVVILVGVGVPSAVSAQVPVSSFEQVATKVKTGDTVYVTDSTGTEYKGKLSDVSVSSLTLQTDGTPRQFLAATVTMVRRQQRDSLKNGLFIGLGIGAAIGVLGAATCSGGDSSDCNASARGLFALTSAGIGVGLGVGIDALVPGKKALIYRADSRSSAATINIFPIVSPTRRGLAVRVVF